MTDTNIYLSRWPTRRLPYDDPAELVAKLKSVKVTQAWAGSFDGLLHRDVRAVNERLYAECMRYGGNGFLLPFGTINPTLPGWRDDLALCQDRWRMKGVRLHPGYHGYGLKDAIFGQVLAMARDRKMLVQLAAEMEDERTQHPLFRAAPVNLADLPAALAQAPGVRIAIQNLRSPSKLLLKALAGADDVYFDFSTIEGIYGLSGLVEDVGVGRILFGSKSPLFYFESNTLKLREAAIAGPDADAIVAGNAGRLLAG